MTTLLERLGYAGGVQLMESSVAYRYCFDARTVRIQGGDPCLKLPSYHSITFQLQASFI